MNISILSGLFIITASVCFNCTARIVEDFAYEYYPVTINADDQYDRATASASPYKSTDSTAIGLHRVGFRWTWLPKKNENNNRCEMTNFTLFHTTRISLPELMNSATEKQARQFHYYAELIKLHELEHYYIAKNYAAVLEQRIIHELSSVNQCSEIEGRIERIYQSAMIELKQQQNDFDRRDYQISKPKQVERLLHR